MGFFPIYLYGVRSDVFYVVLHPFRKLWVLHVPGSAH